MDTPVPVKPPVLPTIHLGGTARATLLEDTTDALDALRDALRAMTVTTPHARDYPKAGDITQAIVQHQSRRHRIESVIKELEALAEHIAG
jgi:hypothetical protein